MWLRGLLALSWDDHHNILQAFPLMSNTKITNSFWWKFQTTPQYYLFWRRLIGARVCVCVRVHTCIPAYNKLVVEHLLRTGACYSQGMGPYFKAKEVLNSRGLWLQWALDWALHECIRHSQRCKVNSLWPKRISIESVHIEPCELAKVINILAYTSNKHL